MADEIGIAHSIDEATQFSFKWYQDLMAELPGAKVEVLQENAVRRKVEEMISDNDGVIIFYDHGNETGLYGSDSQPVIDLNNVDILKEREIYTMACLAGQKLGLSAYTDHGCVTFWGYTQEVVFDTEYADVHEETLNYGLLLHLRDGLSWADAFTQAQAKFNELLITSGSVWTKMWLKHNLDCMVCYNKDVPIPTSPTCPVSRGIKKIFGWQFLWALRSLRKKLFGIKPGYP